MYTRSVIALLCVWSNISIFSYTELWQPDFVYIWWPELSEEQIKSAKFIVRFDE
ncbi:MAG: hypothetical protein IJ525_00575 [Alphaproteobacteria bacterium]|nr:hypothetical protein [Alphaproteobacteria bacterium]